jgi:hypothetical protein
MPIHSAKEWRFRHEFRLLIRPDPAMVSPSIVLPLERPLVEFSPGSDSPRAIVLAGLRWPTEYWKDLAVGWLEQGVALDGEIVEMLLAISEDRRQCSQHLRHRALALRSKYLRELASERTGKFSAE